MKQIPDSLAPTLCSISCRCRGGRLLLSLFLVQMLVLGLFTASGSAEEVYVGKVTELSGTVSLERQKKKIMIVKGTRLMVDDLVKTSDDGAVGLMFKDETTLSLGPKTRIQIQDYVFEPENSRFSFVIEIFKGTASYVSGLLAKLSPESAKFITPSSTIGIRGTKFVIQVDGL